MKYGILKYMQQFMNIGDCNQSIGLENVYKKMGIFQEDIVYIEKANLSEYAGDYVILPLAANCDYWYESKMFPLSDKIIPIFFGFRCVDDFHLRFLEEYKKNGEIIGCRDVYNMKLLRKMGFNAYVSGCLSLQSGECRESTPKDGKVYLIDIPDTLEDFLPTDIALNGVRLTQKFYRYDITKEEAGEFELQTARERLDELRTNARLVVTQRLHCALPCVAMGIPVILAIGHGTLDDRYTGYSDMVDIYWPEIFDRINWNPEAHDITDLKKQQYELLKELIIKKAEEHEKWARLSSYFENTPKYLIANNSGIDGGYLSLSQKKEWLQQDINRVDLLTYIFNRNLGETVLYIWGAGDRGKWFVKRYQKYIPSFLDVRYVDISKEKQNTTLNGFDIVSPSEMFSDKRNKVVVVAIASSYREPSFSIKSQLILEYGMTEGEDFFMLDKLNKSANISLDDFGTSGWMDEHVWF